MFARGPIVTKCRRRGDVVDGHTLGAGRQEGAVFVGEVDGDGVTVGTVGVGVGLVLSGGIAGEGIGAAVVHVDLIGGHGGGCGIGDGGQGQGVGRAFVGVVRTAEGHGGGDVVDGHTLDAGRQEGAVFVG